MADSDRKSSLMIKGIPLLDFIFSTLCYECGDVKCPFYLDEYNIAESRPLCLH